MPIGKDSIKTRVAKVAPVEDEAAKVETPTEVKAPAKKSAAKAATKKPVTPKAESETATKKAAAPKKPAAKKPATPKAPKTEAPTVETPAVEAPVVETAVLANVSPETVAAVIGHDEKKPSDKVKIGQKMPTYLL